MPITTVATGKPCHYRFLRDAATCPANMGAPGYALQPLKCDLEGHWAVRVSGNWRLTFAFEGEDAILVDYQDYH